MRDPHRGVRGVDALAPRARRAVDVDLEFLGLDVDLDLLGLRQDGHRACRGVYPPGRLRLRHSLDAVDACLVLHAGVDLLARHGEDYLLETSQLGRPAAQDLHLPSAPRRVCGVHAEDDRGEERRLLAARARSDLDYHVALVVLVTREQHPAQLVVELLPEPLEAGGILPGDRHQVGVAAVEGLAHLGEGGLVLLDGREHLQYPAERRPLGGERLQRGGVPLDGRGAELLVDLGQPGVYGLSLSQRVPPSLRPPRRGRHRLRA